LSHFEVQKTDADTKTMNPIVKFIGQEWILVATLMYYDHYISFKERQGGRVRSINKSISRWSDLKDKVVDYYNNK
jgi:hypothetical protein